MREISTPNVFLGDKLMKLIPMPSPRGTNHERLYMSPHRGAAYDARGGLLGYDKQLARDAAQDPVAVLQKWVVDNLDDDAQNRLIQALANKPSRLAQDDDAAPSFDPNASRSNVPAQAARLRAGTSAMDSNRRRQIAQDARFGAVMKAAFARPGSAAFDARQRRKLAADAATTKSLAERYPGFGAIGVQAEEKDRNAGPHSMANDGRLVRSLEERFPDIAKIKFA
jgi:hypothetical protein